jgi:DNA-binding transcriptional regulator LsrR (DeoR family)
VAVIGIGTIQPTLASLQRAGYLDAEDLARLEEIGTVGDVLARPLDADGCVLDVAVRRRVIGLEESMLRAIPRVIAVAGGTTKAPAILAALRGRYVNFLVTDASTAGEILRLEGLRRGPRDRNADQVQPV